jgi:hypothetical protein
MFYYILLPEKSQIRLFRFLQYRGNVSWYYRRDKDVEPQAGSAFFVFTHTFGGQSI